MEEHGGEAAGAATGALIARSVRGGDDAGGCG